MELNEQIQLCYQNFYIKFCGSNSYLFVPTESNKKTISKFIKWLDTKYGKRSVGINMLFEFFALQFYYYSHPGAIQSKRYIQIGHIIGDKATERWENKNQYDSKDSISWASSIGVLVSDISEVINYTEPKITLNQLEDIERKRFYNTSYGLTTCLTLTSGYQKNNDYCKLCKWSIDCRKMKDFNG